MARAVDSENLLQVRSNDFRGFDIFPRTRHVVNVLRAPIEIPFARLIEKIEGVFKIVGLIRLAVGPLNAPLDVAFWILRNDFGRVAVHVNVGDPQTALMPMLVNDDFDLIAIRPIADRVGRNVDRFVAAPMFQALVMVVRRSRTNAAGAVDVELTESWNRCVCPVNSVTKMPPAGHAAATADADLLARHRAVDYFVTISAGIISVEMKGLAELISSFAQIDDDIAVLVSGCGPGSVARPFDCLKWSLLAPIVAVASRRGNVKRIGTEELSSGKENEKAQPMSQMQRVEKRPDRSSYGIWKGTNRTVSRLCYRKCGFLIHRRLFE